MHVFVVGYPSGMGGADTELWHVLKLWRQHDLSVTLIPTWTPPYGWQEKCESIGVTTTAVDSAEYVSQIPSLRGSLVVSFCNGDFLTLAARLRKIECRLIWVGCMTWLFDAEIDHYKQHGPFDAYVFQSRFQRDTLFPRLHRFGIRTDQCHLIRGAFDPLEFPFHPRPHSQGETFVVGRLSRVDADKWHPKTWQIYDSIPFRPIRARVMAWEDHLARSVGPPPPWTETLSGGDQTPHAFLKSLHCLMQLSGLATENWPRVGLEAMATGVPIITDRRGGWPEMIRHGYTGFITGSPEEAALAAGRIAAHDDLRLEITTAAHDDLTRRLCRPDTIMAGWQKLFEQVSLNRGAA